MYTTITGLFKNKYVTGNNDNNQTTPQKFKYIKNTTNITSK